MVVLGKALIILTVWALWPGALLAVFSRRDLPTVERPLRAIDAERVELVAWFFTCLGIIVFLIGAETKEEAALVAGGTNLIAGMVLNASAILSALVGGLRGEPSRRALRAMVPAFVLALVHQGAFDAVFGGKPADLPGSLVLSWLGQIWMPLGLAALYLAWKLVTRPMKQRERTRLFVELLETCVAEGRSAEEAISELSRRGDPTFGPEFRRLAERIEKGAGLVRALRETESFVPRELVEMLAAAQETGDLAGILPACRKVAGEHLSRTRGAFSYVLVMTPAFVAIAGAPEIFLMVFIVPRIAKITSYMGMRPSRFVSLLVHPMFRAVMVVSLLLPLMLVAAWAAGPTIVRRLHMRWLIERIAYLVPWRRMRMQRDLSAMLAALLDAEVPEPRALELAAAATANAVFAARAKAASHAIAEGRPLTEAVSRLDDSGEFMWRLTNAARGGLGFSAALAGWHESLDARSFRSEQSFAHVATTLLVTLNGAVVGMVVIGTFKCLIDMTASIIPRF